MTELMKSIGDIQRSGQDREHELTNRLALAESQVVECREKILALGYEKKSLEVALEAAKSACSVHEITIASLRKEISDLWLGSAQHESALQLERAADSSQKIVEETIVGGMTLLKRCGEKAKSLEQETSKSLAHPLGSSSSSSLIPSVRPQQSCLSLYPCVEPEKKASPHQVTIPAAPQLEKSSKVTHRQPSFSTCPPPFILNPPPWSDDNDDDDDYRCYPTATAASSFRTVHAKAIHHIITTIASSSTDSGRQRHVPQSTSSYRR